MGEVLGSAASLGSRSETQPRQCARAVLHGAGGTQGGSLRSGNSRLEKGCGPISALARRATRVGNLLVSATSNGRGQRAVRSAPGHRSRRSRRSLQSGGNLSPLGNEERSGRAVGAVFHQAGGSRSAHLFVR